MRQSSQRIAVCVRPIHSREPNCSTQDADDGDVIADQDKHRDYGCPARHRHINDLCDIKEKREDEVGDRYEENLTEAFCYGTC